MASSGTKRIRSVNQDVANSSGQFTIVIAGPATGDGPVSAQWDRVLTSSYMPGAGEVASDIASSLAGAINTGHNPTYIAGPGLAANEVVVSRADGRELIPLMAFSADSTATMTLAGKHVNERVIVDATAIGTGTPTGIQSGYGVTPSLPVDDRTNTVTVNFQLSNFSGGAKVCRWRMWWYTPGIGWAVDQEVGTRTISDPAATTPSFSNDIISVTSIGASRVACELVDNGAAGALTASQADAWVVSAH